jgi:hypothetical protein
MWKRNVFLALIIALAPSQSLAAQFGKWNNDEAHGYERYWTENAKGARFTIWCPPNHDARGALLSIDIKGRHPSPRSLVHIELDRKLIKFKTDSKGFVRNDCAACVDNMTYFWHHLRVSMKFAIQLEDKRYAGFSLKGVKEAIPKSVCSRQLAGNSR